MTQDKNQEKTRRDKQPIMTEKVARAKILSIEGGKDGIVALDREVRDLDREASRLMRKRNEQRVAIENMKSSGFFGTAKVFLGGAQAGLEATEAALSPLIEQIHQKSPKVYRGITDVENIVDRFMDTDRHYKMADVVQVALQKVNMMAKLYSKAIHNAQIKIEGALNAGTGEEASQMIGTDITLYTEQYNQAASQALVVVKMNATSLHKALQEYASDVESDPNWKVSVAIDEKSAISVDLLTKPHYLDVYTPKTLEDIKAQLHLLNQAVETIIEQVHASNTELQNLKKAYFLAKKKKLCDHIFDEKDKAFHEERAKSTWGADKQEDAD